ncbi:MAG: glycoside hydrolase family 5 protein [Clostridiales bacterium]|nr:glycoside hydrolase family 5 protein [Clostridiales bacterium]
MRRRKIIAAVLVAALGLGLMGGCGNGTNAFDTQSAEEKGSAGTEATAQGVAEETEEASEEDTYVKTPNINPEMEDLTAMDVVNEIKIGFNIGNTLDSTNDKLARVEPSFKFETAWGNPKVSQEFVDAVLDAGFNVIRIPVTWENHFAPAPDYTIVESWLDRVQEVVDYAYNKGAYVIINMHHEDWNYPYYDNEETACEEMAALWSQIAERFKDYDEHLIFEAQNEPRKVGTSVEWTGGDQEGWDVVNATNLAFINAVRDSGGSNPYRMLMIPGYGANSTVGIQHIEVPEDDDRIIISVHAYEPYDFALNTAGRSEWNNDTTAIDTLMEDLKTLFIDKGIPVIIGEFGAMNKDNESERAEWATYYVSAAAAIGVPCIWWDNGAYNTSGENFGLIDRNTGECAYPDLLQAMMDAAWGSGDDE